MYLKIKELRNKKKISQDDLSKKTGISKRMIIDYEKNNSDIPLKKLQIIATALEVPFYDLISFAENDVGIKKQTLNDPGNEYSVNPIEVLKDYNGHLKRQVDQLINEIEFLKNIINSKILDK